jgi:amino acid transporter
VAQIVSVFPALRTPVASVLVGFVMFVNLRGVKESGSAFALPTYFFVTMMFLTVGTGLVRLLAGTLHPIADPPPLDIAATRGLGLFLLLHAFSSGTTALTGVEAISNGIPAFKEPRSRNAGITLLWMSGILGTLFLGISYLAGPIGRDPQLARARRSRGGGFTWRPSPRPMILVMAANTAYADFPRLAALQAVSRGSSRTGEWFVIPRHPIAGAGRLPDVLFDAM